MKENLSKNEMDVYNLLKKSDVKIPLIAKYDSKLKPNAIILLGEIITLDENNLNFEKKPLSLLHNIHISTIYAYINDLIKFNYIIKINPKEEDIFNKLNKKNNKDFGCLFCGYDKTSSALEQHHYPVRAKNNGRTTITLCANCHRDFHHYVDYSYKFSINWEKINNIKEEV